LPLLVMVDLLSTHWVDVPSVDPRYWTVPPPSAERLKSSSGTIRVFGIGDKSAGEPGYASERVDFMAVRDPLDWSLPLAWHLNASRGNTPMISRRIVDFGEHVPGNARYDLEGDTYIVTGRNRLPNYKGLRAQQSGAAFVHFNRNALPRARLIGKPVYVDNQIQAIAAVEQLGAALRDQLVVEDPGRPLAAGAQVSGKARIVKDLPEQVVVEADAGAPAYLVLSDTFDPGWSATLDGQPAPIWPAYIAFRAVYLPQGPHTVVFTYRPAGFELGLLLTGCGVLLGLVFWFQPRRSLSLAAEHAVLDWPSRWRTWFFSALGTTVLISAVAISPNGVPRRHSRWKDSVHTHTWGAGYLAMKANRK
jgi:Bacterial membrane protein YfhO